VLTTRLKRDQGIRDKAIFDGATLQAFENVINEDLLELPDFIRMVTLKKGTMAAQRIQAVKNAMQGIDNGSEEEWVRPSLVLLTNPATRVCCRRSSYETTMRKVHMRRTWLQSRRPASLPVLWRR
jgi:hypothetical protein